MALSTCPPWFFDWTGVASLALLLWGIGLLVEESYTKIGKPAIACGAFLSALLATMACMLEKTSRYLTGSNVIVLKPTEALMELPAAAIILVLVAAAGIQTVLTARLLAFRKSTMDSESVKEAFDSLPDAVLFSAQDGRQVLRNTKAIELGISPESTEGLLNHTDGRTWQLARKHLSVENSQVEELVGTDVTEEYALVQELERRNAQLEEVNRRMRAYSANMVSITREEEVLAAKMRVHDELGNALVALRAYELQDPSLRDRDALLDIWRRAVRLLRTAADPDEHPRDAWEQLVEAARAIDVQLVLEGELPRSAQQRAAAVVLVHECLNNAVRHGGAHRVSVLSERTPGGITVTVENDGVQPDGPRTETGGLAYARKVVEQAGGTMDVAWTPRFSVAVSFDCEGGGHA